LAACSWQVRGMVVLLFPCALLVFVHHTEFTLDHTLAMLFARTPPATRAKREHDRGSRCDHSETQERPETDQQGKQHAHDGHDEACDALQHGNILVGYLKTRTIQCN